MQTAVRRGPPAVKTNPHGVVKEELNIDVSPFTCMNGIICEAVYPRVSRDLGGIPIRNFYFDGTQSDLDRDLGVYLELARTYQRRKKYQRVFPKTA